MKRNPPGPFGPFDLAADPGGLIAGIGPIDPDTALAADYLAREATREQEAEFERRFVEDDAFYMKVAPLMKVWDLTANVSELMARPRTELRAEREGRLRREAAALAEAATVAESTLAPAAPPAQPVVVPPVLSEPAGKTRIRGPNFVLTVIQVAAALVIVVGLALQYWVSRAPRARLLEQGFVVEPAPGPDSALRKAGVVPGPSATGAPRLIRIPQPPPAPAAPPETVRVTPAAPATGRSTPAPTVGELDIIKPMLVAMGQKFSTGEGETKFVELENGAAVLLRPNTTIYYRPMLLIPGMPEQVREMVKRMASVAIEGEAAIAVPGERRDYVVAVSSDAGMATLHGGSYAIRCAKGCTALQVTVRDGEGSLSNLAASATHVFLEKGQLGLAPRLAPPTLVDKSAASLFPQADSTIRATRKVP